MRVLVTGTDGYIGAVLGPRLLNAGMDVVGIDTGFYRAGWLYPAPDPTPMSYRKDIRDITSDDLAGFDAIVHLAELSNDPLGQHDPAITYKINHEGTLSLAKAARRAGVRRFVYTSSCSVYGAANADNEMVDEATAPNPQTAYAECKVRVERDLSAMAGDDFSPCFLRNATAYGASPRMRFDIVLNNLCGHAMTSGKIVLTSDGTPWRPLVHVLDISEAIRLSLLADEDRIRGQIFNVGDTMSNYRIIDVARIVAETFPGCELVVGESDGDNRSYKVGFDKIKRVLPEFECRWTPLKGAHQLLAIFQAIKLSAGDFAAAPFTRLKMLMDLKSKGLIDGELRWTLPSVYSSGFEPRLFEVVPAPVDRLPQAVF